MCLWKCYSTIKWFKNVLPQLPHILISLIPQIASFLLNEDRKLSSSSESSSENSIVTYTLTKATLKQNEGAKIIIMRWKIILKKIRKIDSLCRLK